MDAVAFTQVAQVQAISAGGFAVKNTFIDEPTPVCSRRACSAPPVLSRVQAKSLGDLGDFQDTKSTSFCSIEDCQQDVQGVPPNFVSWSSTFCPESDSASETSESTLLTPGTCTSQRPSGCAPPPLQMLIENDFGLFRIQRCVLHPLNQQGRHKALPDGVNTCLRVFMEGLPVAKRSKWQVPLGYAMLSLLQCKGCDAFVKRGQLFARLQGSADGEVVRVDFSPGKATWSQ